MTTAFEPILVGMFDSPYVRRVAVTLHLYAMPFAHQPWSVFANADRVRSFNPVGRVPALQISPQETLIDSSAIIDYLDEQVSAAKRLLPASGVPRRQMLKQVAVALATCDKAVGMIYERRKRDATRFDPGWDSRLADQLLLGGHWLNEQLTVPEAVPNQAQVTAAITYRFVQENFVDCDDFLALPVLANLSAHCEALPAFIQAPFSS